jgi:uncharacterized protein (TIGR03437 family)
VVGFTGGSQGDIYVVGSPYSDFVATPGVPYPVATSQADSYLAKFDPQGKQIFATYIPGIASLVAVDQGGNALVLAGEGLSTSNQRVVLVAVDSNGKTAAVSTVLTCAGCWSRSFPQNIATDGVGNVYLAGYTTDPHLPVTPRAFQTDLKSQGASDVFVIKYSLLTGNVVYATYLGGSGQDVLYALSADSAGNAYVSGSTSSSDFPVTSLAYETQVPNSNPGFVAKVSPDGATLTYSSYFDAPPSIVALDSAGGASLNTGSVLFKLSPDGRRVVSSVPLDVPGSITVDPSGNLVVASGTFSPTLATVNPLQLLGSPGFPLETTCYSPSGNPTGCLHAVLAKLDPGGKVLWSSVMGGSGYTGVETSVAAVSVDASGNIYAAVVGFGLVKVEAVGPAPLLANAAVVSSAGFRKEITRGGLASLFGTGLTTLQGIVAAPSFPLPLTLEGTSVSIGGQPAPILAVANVNGAEQINVQVPFQLASFLPPGVPSITVRRGRALGFAFDVVASDDWPSIFVGSDGQPAVTHADYNLVTADNPAHAGETIIIWSTGGGAVTPPVDAGAAAPSSPFSRTVTTPVVSIGGKEAPVTFSGLAPGYAGLYQINAVVPSVSAGQTKLAVGTSNIVTNTVMISVQ